MTNVLNKKELPLVFAVDDNYAPFLCVCLNSIMANVSKDYFVKVYILNTGLSKNNEERIVEIAESNSSDISIEYVDVADRLDGLHDKMHLRDYYTKTIYYRIFIPSLFPKYEKIIYVDCDIVLIDDISKLYSIDLGDNVLAAVHEEAMSTYDCFGKYSEDFLGVPKTDYFNSGLLVINTKQWQVYDIENNFIKLMIERKFEVAPDQDYLNVLCKGKVKLIDVGWNKTPIPNKVFDDNKISLIHYKLNFKPWHYFGVRYEEYFWKYAKDTPFYQDLLNMRNSFSNEDKKADDVAFIKLQEMALRYVDSDDNYKNVKKMEGRY